VDQRPDRGHMRIGSRLSFIAPTALTSIGAVARGALRATAGSRWTARPRRAAARCAGRRRDRAARRLGTSIPRFEARFGDYVKAPLLAEWRGREDDRRTARIDERLELTAREPGVIIDRCCRAPLRLDACGHRGRTRAHARHEPPRARCGNRRDGGRGREGVARARYGAVLDAVVKLRGAPRSGRRRSASR